MILGIGVDTVLISRIAETYENQGDAFINRCFGLAEIDYILSAGSENIRAGRMAKRWAAKEAYAKALGTGISSFANLKDICVIQDDRGKPEVVVENTALETLNRLARGHGSPKIHLSLGDEGDYAQAFVVLSAEKD